MPGSTRIAAGVGVFSALTLAGTALAQDAAPAIDSGDTAWMLASTVLVTLMVVPGVALFYGGLVRAKNMLSVLTQVFAVFCVACVVWILWGYSMAFTDGGSLNAFVGGLSKFGLIGVGADSVSGTIPEYVFISFQMTFAGITAALIVGGFAERVNFGGLMVFTVLWLTLVYLPMAHMVWGGEGALLWDAGALDFAGGTVVHINSGVAALVGALIIGKRVGFGKEALTPHSLPMTMIGASLLWVGWFGFNAGSAAAANGAAGLAMISTFAATAAGALAWQFGEWLTRGHPSMLGLVSGAVAGLVAITPAAGVAGPLGAIALGGITGLVCLFACTTLKNALGYDDSLDVFGIHGMGGMVGALGTAIVAMPGLGGTMGDDYDVAVQLLIQAESIVVTLLWSGLISAALFVIVKALFGMRVKEESEREGLDIATHGERAYN